MYVTFVGGGGRVKMSRVIGIAEPYGDIDWVSRINDTRFLVCFEDPENLAAAINSLHNAPFQEQNKLDCSLYFTES